MLSSENPVVFPCFDLIWWLILVVLSLVSNQRRSIQANNNFQMGSFSLRSLDPWSHRCESNLHGTCWEHRTYSQISMETRLLYLQKERRCLYPMWLQELLYRVSSELCETCQVVYEDQESWRWRGFHESILWSSYTCRNPLITPFWLICVERVCRDDWCSCVPTRCTKKSIFRRSNETQKEKEKGTVSESTRHSAVYL